MTMTDQRDRLQRGYNALCMAEHELALAGTEGLAVINQLEPIRWELGHIAFPRAGGETDGTEGSE